MWIWNFIWETILSEIILIALGFGFGTFVKNRWDQWRHGGWEIKVMRDHKELVRRKISPRKKKEILEDDADLSVYTKGVASPYAHINCDIVEEGRKVGLLLIEPQYKLITINLDQNPLPKHHPTASLETNL